MKRIRTVFFWTHLTAGVLASVVIFVMSATGVALALKPQIQEWIERDVRFVTPGDARLGPHALLTAVKRARPEAPVQSLVVARDPEKAASVGLGRETVYVNPYSGQILGAGSQKTTEFFQWMTSWHRYLNMTGESRDTGRWWTGASNLAFLLLGLTGLWIWFPKQLTAQYLRPILWFTQTSTGKARDFNWHNTIGFWCSIPIVIMTLSGTIISYPWASNLVYTLTGSPVPQRGGGPGGGGGRGEGGVRPDGGPRTEGGRGQQGGPRAEGGRGQAGARRVESARADGPRAEGGARAEGPRGGGGDAVGVIPANLDAIWARAEEKMPSWSLLNMRLPAGNGGPVTFTITDGDNWNQFARSNLTVNSATAEVASWQPYSDSSRGQVVRGWLRFAHTGELGGLTGQIIAGIGCLGGVFLVYTGVTLAFRRLWNWSLWKRFRAEPRTVTARNTASAID